MIRCKLIERLPNGSHNITDVVAKWGDEVLYTLDGRPTAWGLLAEPWFGQIPRLDRRFIGNNIDLVTPANIAI